MFETTHLAYTSKYVFNGVLEMNQIQENSFQGFNIELAAFQTIQNAQLAINYFLVELEDAKFVKQQGRFFLGYYGFLQAVVNQQNCVMSLYKLRKGKKLKLPSEIATIRAYRNQSVGHPSAFNTIEGEKFAYMTETYITEDKQIAYMILGSDDDVDDLVYIDPVEISIKNREFIGKILIEIYGEQARLDNPLIWRD